MITFLCFPQRSRFSRPAFTLLELLVSMSVAVLLIVLLLQIFSTSTTNWQQGEARIDAYREARAALQLISRDLSQTVQSTSLPPPGASPSPTPTTTGPMPVLVLDRSPESIPTVTSYAFEEAYCLTAIQSNVLTSDLSAVGYFCQWDGTKNAYVLMRQLANSDITYNFLTAARTHQPIVFGDLYSRMPQAGGTAVTTDLASYIWDLQFRIDTSLKTPVTEPPVPPQSRTQAGRCYSVNPPYPDYLPPYVEVRFKAISTAAAKQLVGKGITQLDWQDPPTKLYQKFILPSAQQFTARVPLLNYNAAAAVATPSPTP